MTTIGQASLEDTGSSRVLRRGYFRAYQIAIPAVINGYL